MSDGEAEEILKSTFGSLFSCGYSIDDLLSMSFDQIMFVAECRALYHKQFLSGISGGSGDSSQAGQTSKPNSTSSVPQVNPKTGAKNFEFDEENVGKLKNEGFNIKVIGSGKE